MQDDGWFDPIHKRLCDFIQYHIEAAGESDVKLQITMPRGSLKTTIVTKYLPVWLTLSDPTMRSLIATNTHTNARKKLNDIRGLFDTNKLFQSLFPKILPTKRCRWTEEVAEINRERSFPEGTFECCGVGTKMEGRHYNLIIEDDTVAPDESDTREEITQPSQEDIVSAIGWHKKTTALLVPKGRRIRVVVTTRWADEDLVWHIRKNETGYKFFDMPALNAAGEPNFSMFYSKEKLEEIKQQIGMYMFSCMYLNRPLDPSQRAFRSETFHRVKPHEIPSEGRVTVAVDPAISEKSDACDSAITVVLHHRAGGNVPNQYWLKAVLKRMPPHELVNTAIDLAIEYSAKSIIVETVAFQKALKYSFRDRMAELGVQFNLVEFVSRIKKELRIYALQPLFENGRIFFVEGLDPRIENQLKAFPHGRLVDGIDSFSMHMKGYNSTKRIVDTGAEPVRQEDGYFAVLKELRDKYSKSHPPEQDVASLLDSGMAIPVGSFITSFFGRG
jgi:predicted phage terminase large subunit-like protein